MSRSATTATHCTRGDDAVSIESPAVGDASHSQDGAIIERDEKLFDGRVQRRR
jgi:hypothetical protein